MTAPELNDLFADLDETETTGAPAQSGAKQAAWRMIMMGLRNSVRGDAEKPRLTALVALQETYLLNAEQITRYVVNKNPCQLNAIQCSLAKYLLFKTKNKPQRYTTENLLVMQRVCLLKEDLVKPKGHKPNQEITNNVIRWWERQKHDG